MWEHRVRKAHLLSNIAVCLHRKNDLDAAMAIIREAITVQVRLVEEWSDNPGIKGNLAISFKQLAYILGGLKRNEESEAAFARAASLWRSALESDPDNRGYRYRSAVMLNLLGLVQKGVSKRFAIAKRRSPPSGMPSSALPSTTHTGIT